MYLCPKTKGNKHKHTFSSMPCELDFGNDFACDCPLPKNIIQMHTSESSSVQSYYLQQMHMCQMGSRLFEIKLSKPTSWGACFCRQYLEKKCALTRMIRNHRLLGDSTDKVIFEMHFQQAVLSMAVSPISVGLTLVPIQLCVRRFVQHQRILKQKALYWANAMTQMCTKQKGACPTISPALHQIASSEDLMQMILQQCFFVHSPKA